MKSYLGEFPIDTTTHPDFNNLTPTDWALRYIWMYGQIDGAHHKQWVIDQIARVLNGAPVVVTEARWDNGYSEYRHHAGTSEKYESWVKLYVGEDDEGYPEYSYDTGINP